jgi:hypothetical protein
MKGVTVLFILKRILFVIFYAFFLVLVVIAGAGATVTGGSFLAGLSAVKYFFGILITGDLARAFGFVVNLLVAVLAEYSKFLLFVVALFLVSAIYWVFSELRKKVSNN